MRILGCMAVLGFLALTVGETDEPPPMLKTSAGPGAEVQHEYVGIKRCRMCHTPQYESFVKSAKAGSWKALLPAENAAIKDRAGLDPQADYTTDTRCLECHATGLGEPGGYAIPDSNDPLSQRFAETRQGVGCESCHGPGSRYAAFMREISLSERQYNPAEAVAAGRHLVTDQTCLKCHNQRAICMKNASDDSWLRVNVDDRHGFHDKFPLKFRKLPDGKPDQREAN